MCLCRPCSGDPRDYHRSLPSRRTFSSKYMSKWGPNLKGLGQCHWWFSCCDEWTKNLIINTTPTLNPRYLEYTDYIIIIITAIYSQKSSRRDNTSVGQGRQSASWEHTRELAVIRVAFDNSVGRQSSDILHSRVYPGAQHTRTLSPPLFSLSSAIRQSVRHLQSVNQKWPFCWTDNNSSLGWTRIERDRNGAELRNRAPHVFQDSWDEQLLQPQLKFEGRERNYLNLGRWGWRTTNSELWRQLRHNLNSKFIGIDGQLFGTI